MNPYLVLNVPMDADDKTIRNAYLTAVKAATPDRNPDRFQAVADAYERIKTERSRLAYLMFDTTCPGDSPLEAIQKSLVHMSPPKPLSFDSMKELLRNCAKP
ncbi:MAG TPA: J domain-containing protein [Verrucomicrobiales bacterium]|jgi:curved DNA-binding protein CbpA|nr:J domain-containing protein [Verrucomicrobiales bacterium]HIL69646.1 J domain-containing protein [Verrucomicrobiota bacterium]